MFVLGAAGASDAVTAVLVALIGALGLVLVAIIPLLVSTRRHAKEANLAVNCKPPGEPKISEQVETIAKDMVAMRYVTRDLAHVKGDVRELRREQAAMAVALGEHLAGDA